MKTLLVATLLIAVPLVAVAPTAEAGPNCWSIYNEWEVGPVTIVQRSSCHYEVYVNGQNVIGP